MPAPPSPAPLKALDQHFRRYATDCVSAQVFEEGLCLWQHELGSIVYCDTGSAWITFASPLTAATDQETLLKEFAKEAFLRERRVRYFGCEAPLPGMKSLRIGEQGIWNNEGWASIKASHKSLREQLRRAKAKGVVCTPCDHQELSSETLQQEIESLLVAWQQNHPMPPMGFAVALDPFCNPNHRRILLARQGETLVGVLVTVVLPATKTCFVEDLLRHPSAPNGTSEALIDASFAVSSREGAQQTSLGLAPLSGTISLPLRVIADISTPLFDFGGLRRFKEKLRPHKWQPVYLCYPEEDSSWSAVIDSLRAFAGGSFFRYAGQLLAHRAGALLWLMSWLLLPWVALLASPSASHWFPREEIQTAWVLFDLFLFGVLTRTSLFPSRSALLFCSTACLADASLGLWQWIAFSRHAASGIAANAIGIAALLAPLCVLLILLLALKFSPTLYWRWSDPLGDA